MKFLVFGIFISVCYAFDFDCLKGPKYWCASYQNAEKCERITECFMGKAEQKNKGEVLHNFGENCDVCLKFVQTVESFIPKITELQFVNLAASVICNKVQGRSLWKCKEEISKFTPLVYRELSKESTPEKICGLAQMCKNNKAMSFAKIFRVIQVENDELCVKCKEIFNYVDSMFSKITVDEFKYLVESLVCMQLPSELQATCKVLIDGYVSQLYNLIKTLLEGDRICPLIHFCPSNYTRNFLSSWNCQTCLDVVVVLRKDLVNIPTADIESLIRNSVCSKLNFIAKGVCNDYVSSLVPKFINDLNSQLTPQQICQNNQLCMNPRFTKPLSVKGVVECDLCEIGVTGLKSFISNPENINKVKSFVKKKICIHLKSMSSKCSSLVEIYGYQLITLISNHMDSKTICISMNACKGLSISQIKYAKNLKGIECDACHLVVKKFKEFMSDPAKKTILKNFLKDKLCAVFGSKRVECQQVVDEFFDVIWNFVLSEFDVDKVCKSMDMCSRPKLNGIKCDVCERVMDEVVKLVFSNHSEQMAFNFAINKICPRLDFLKTECSDLVNIYLPVLFSIARSTLNSKVLCAELNLCSLISQKKFNVLLKTGLKSNSIKCEICQLVVTDFKSLLTNPQIQTSIEEFLKNVICSHFGAQKQQCINDINQYYSLVINIVVEFLKPSLCNELRLCNSTKTSIIMSQPLSKISRPKQSSKCQLCEKFYNYLQLIYSKKTDTSLVIGLISLCDQANGIEKSKCLQHYRNFNAIITAFNKSGNIFEFCQMTKICMRSKRRFFGDKPCSWGPTYWCMNRQNAIECGPGAVKHCEMKVWINMSKF